MKSDTHDTYDAGGTALADPPASLVPQADCAPGAMPEPVAAEEPIRTSRVPATIGRDLHLYVPGHWLGPQPAKVVEGSMPSALEVREGLHHTVDVNVFVSGVRFPSALAFMRQRPAGNTFAGVPLYDALTDSQRHRLRANGVGVWAEWPPRV